MPFDEDEFPSELFSRLRNHEAREVIDARRKFQWRYTTLSSDYRSLIRLGNLSIHPSGELEQQLQERGYIFEVERRLHHYLAELYTLIEIHQTIQDGIGEDYRDELSGVEDQYRGEESSRVLFGLRHYVQHENVLPLQPYSSSIEGQSRLVILLSELHMQEEYQDGFEAHYGHIDELYCQPLELVEENWPHVELLYQETMEIVAERAEAQIEEYQELLGYVEELNEEIHQQLLSAEPSFENTFFDDGGE